MSVSIKNQGLWQSSAALRLATGFAGFALLGWLLSTGIFHLFERFGIAGAAALVVGLPLGFVIAIGAVPELFSGIGSLARDFSWRQWLWALLFVSAMTFEVGNVHEMMSSPLANNKWVALRLGSELIVAILMGWRVVSGKSSLKYLYTGLSGFMGLYCLICLVSTTWSIVPLFTLFKTAEYSLDVVAAALIYESTKSSEDYVKVLNWTYIVFALETGSAWLGAVISPSDAFDEMGRLSGTFPMVGPNGVGTTGAILTLVAISRLLTLSPKGRSRAWYWAVIAFGVASMVVSQTRNAWAGFLLGFAALLILTKRKWILVAVASSVIPLLGLTSLGTIVVTYLRRGQDDDAIRGLTTRTDFWSVAWEQVSHHPFTGLGAYAGGRFGVLEKIGRIDTGSIHSDWVGTLVGTSFWGVFALLAALIGTFWFLLRGLSSLRLSKLERALTVECTGVLVLLTLHSIFNDELAWHPPLMFLAFLGWAEFLRRKLKASESPSPSRAAYPPEIPAQFSRFPA
jgi:O-antigen ligase